jgi:hypothetical protein
VQYNPKTVLTHTRLFTYDEVLAAVCPYCKVGMPVDYSDLVGVWRHMHVTSGHVEIRECVANDWRRSHPR